MNEARFFNVRDGVVTILSARELSVYVGLFAVHSLDLPPRVLSRTSANGFHRERSSVCIFAKKRCDRVYHDWSGAPSFTGWFT